MKTKIIFLLCFNVLFFFFYKTNQSLASSNIAATKKPTSDTENLIFPKNFNWCVATSAHQIEGGNDKNDWWFWENLKPSKIKNQNKSGRATDHWNRVAEDTKLMVDLGIQQYRFSIEWSRIEPVEGQFDLNAMNHYQEEIDELRNNGIEPMVTLHHFTSPLWFAKAGGWTNDQSPQKFLNFVKYVNQHLGQKVDQWITFNEPMVMIAGGYVSGVFPPGVKHWASILKPIRNILLSHALAYHELHLNNRAQVGIAHHLRIMDPYNKLNPIDWYLANKLSKAFNWTFLNALKTGLLSISIPTKINYKETLPQLVNTQDFIGVNYYSRDLVKFTPGENESITIVTNDKSPRSDLNWEIYPKGLGSILKSVNKLFGTLPIYITENGIADKSDLARPEFIKQHLRVLHKSISSGINIQGYCHWSLLDNFEWAEGFAPRFGLYSVDYITLERTPRESALLYKKIISNNGL